MDRALRRHRTEMVRARRIAKYSNIESRWADEFKTDDNAARFWQAWYSQFFTYHNPWDEVRERTEKNALRASKMRNEYIVGHRDDYYWLCGKIDHAKAIDADHRRDCAEFGVRLRIRRTGKGMYV